MDDSRYTPEELAELAECAEPTVQAYEDAGYIRSQPHNGERCYGRVALGRVRLIEALIAAGVSRDTIGFVFTAEGRDRPAGVYARCVAAGLDDAVAELAQQCDSRKECAELMQRQHELARARAQLESCMDCTRDTEQCGVCADMGRLDWTAGLVLVND